jgi:hypothetical protein
MIDEPSPNVDDGSLFLKLGHLMFMKEICHVLYPLISVESRGAREEVHVVSDSIAACLHQPKAIMFFLNRLLSDDDLKTFSMLNGDDCSFMPETRAGTIFAVSSCAPSLKT